MSFGPAIISYGKPTAFVSVIISGIVHNNFTYVRKTLIYFKDIKMMQQQIVQQESNPKTALTSTVVKCMDSRKLNPE